jgi:TPR repeat protein
MWLLLTFAVAAYAGDIEDATTAYQRKDFGVAMRLLQPLAAQGVSRAQHGVGLMLFKGEGVVQDQTRGLELITTAAQAGDSKAQSFLAYIHYSGMGVTKDHVSATKWAEKAAAQGDSVGQLLLGYAYLNAFGLPRDYERSIDSFRKSAAQDNPFGQYELAKLILLGFGTEAEGAEAEKMLRKVMEKVPNASESVENILAAAPQIPSWMNGTIQFNCRGLSCAGSWGSNRTRLKKHFENNEWLELFSRVVKVGYQVDLAYFYLGRAAEGIGSFDAAAAYYRLATNPSTRGQACAGFINNCNGFIFPKDALDRLGVINALQVEAKEKEDVRQEKLRAEKLIADEEKRQAEIALATERGREADVQRRKTVEAEFEQRKLLAEQGNADAQYSMAQMSFEGIVGSADEKGGVLWLTRAAQQGSANAQYDLGERYRRGAGVPVDLTKSELWFRKAIQQGHEDTRQGYAALLNQKQERANAEAAAKERANAAALAKERAATAAAAEAARKAEIEKQEADRKRKSDNASKLKSL